MATAPKPVDEFVVYTQEGLASDNPTPSSADQPTATAETLAATIKVLNRTDSFPKTLPLPASSILSPTTAAAEKQFPPVSEEPVVSPPETIDSTISFSSMAVQPGSLQSPASEDKVTTPLAELAGTAFDQEVAVRRRGASVVGEEIAENIAALAVADDATPVAKEPAKPLPVELLDEATIAARKNNPAILDSLPQTPSAADFETARQAEGNKFNPEYPNETKVVS